MALEFEGMTPAGSFGGVCQLPIMDLRRFIRDEVLRGIPRFFFRWEDGSTMKILLNDNYAEEAASDDCDFIAVSRQLGDCTVVVPNQKLVAIGFDNLNYQQLMKQFCDAQRLTRFPSLFRRDGSFDAGTQLSGRFIRFLLAELRGPAMAHLREHAWTGDQANRHSFHGILTQLDDGPLVPSGGAGCSLYQPVKLDWADLTGGTGTVHPSATIDADHDEITLHGQAFDGNQGLNVAQFMVLWLERLMEYELAAWADESMEFELWMGTGQTTCIANLAACMQPCDGCVNPMSDPQIRERAAEFRRTKRIWFYPYDNISITIRTSPKLGDKMILVPKTIGGRPMVAWVFRDQEEQQRILDGELPWYGSQPGLPGDNELYPERGEIMEPNSAFEQRAFTLNLQRNGNCIDVWLNTETAIVMFGMHLWLYLDNVSCSGLIPTTIIDQGIPVAVTACDVPVGETTQLELTAAGLEGIWGAVAAGESWLVNFNDGYTQLVGTVVSYNTGTDALILEFGLTIDCDTAKGTAAFGPATVFKLAEN